MSRAPPGSSLPQSGKITRRTLWVVKTATFFLICFEDKFRKKYSHSNGLWRRLDAFATIARHCNLLTKVNICLPIYLTWLIKAEWRRCLPSATGPSSWLIALEIHHEHRDQFGDRGFGCGTLGNRGLRLGQRNALRLFARSAPISAL